MSSLDERDLVEVCGFSAYEMHVLKTEFPVVSGVAYSPGSVRFTCDGTYHRVSVVDGTWVHMLSGTRTGMGLLDVL